MIRLLRWAGQSPAPARRCKSSTGTTRPRYTNAPADPGGPGQEYVVPVVEAATPGGGSRWWWACPGCGRRAADLFLVADRDRLGCRRCCGLGYASQLTRTRGRRPAGRWVVVEAEVLRWTPATGWVRTTRRR